jgi:aminoglycoside phosphotransferase (APT) family kinase protein
VSEWDAEIEVDRELAGELILAQFPHLDARGLERVGEGWDNSVWATPEGVAFRFPRRAIALPGVRREITVLPWLSAQLPAPIPDARYVGSPSARFPWPWFGSELIDGRELPDAHLPAGERSGLADQLGRFLATLHGLGGAETSALPVDPNARADMSLRVPRTRAMIAAVAEHWPAASRTEPILTAAERLAPPADRVLCHGDLHNRHLLISDAGRLSGVIDWGDVCRAPRSIDLMLFWSLFGPEERRVFLAAYGPVDADTLVRARVVALCLDAMLAAYGIDRGMDAVATEALAGLDRTLVD